MFIGLGGKVGEIVNVMGWGLILVEDDDEGE